MSSPEQSAFCIISKQELQSNSDQEIQAICCAKHVVVHDQFELTLNFDEKGLKTLEDMYKSVTIHGVCTVSLLHSDRPDYVPDYSIENSFDAESSRYLNGTLTDMLRCHRSKSEILNALDFPMVSAPHPPTSFASDLVVFSATINLPLCGHDISFPMASTGWALQQLQVLTISGILIAMASVLTSTRKRV